MYKNNVIDFLQHRANRDKDKDQDLAKKKKESAQLLDLTEKRNEALLEERRNVKRTILTEFISAHVVVPQRGLDKVVIHDVSDNGIAFNLEVEQGQFKVGEEVAMRIYLNAYTYFPFFAYVKNVRFIEEEGVYRCGAEFNKDSFNSEALGHFIKFIETVSASLRTDSGDIIVSNLK